MTSVCMDMDETWSWLVYSITHGKRLIYEKSIIDVRILWMKNDIWLSRLEDLYERAEERSQQLQQTYELHDEWKQRGDKLLYSMIPKSVADSLRSGTDPVNTCKVLHPIFCTSFCRLKFVTLLEFFRLLKALQFFLLNWPTSTKSLLPTQWKPSAAWTPCFLVLIILSTSTMFTRFSLIHFF